jgi:uncharacterized protein YjbI with pentapeptide repeats
LSQWADCEFAGRDFTDEDLSRLRTERVVFSECDFSGVNLSESHHHGSAFRNCTFERTLLCTDKAVLHSADLSGARTTGARLDDADLRGATADPSLWRLTGQRLSRMRHHTMAE